MEKLLGPTLLTSSSSNATAPTTDLNSVDVVALYFSASWCGPCQEFTPNLVNTYQMLQSTGKSFRVVFISADRDAASFKKYYAKMPWDALSFEDAKKYSPALMGKYKVPGYPTLVLLDGKTQKLITKDGVMKVYTDPDGAQFPWVPKTLDQLLGEKLVNNKGESVDTVDALKGKYIGLYFSAHWCGPCRRFTPEFVKFYNAHAKDKNLEVIFVSRDKAPKEYKSYFGEMPWLSIGFETAGDNKAARDELSQMFEVQGIPNLVILDKDTRKVITEDGTAAVYTDPTGKDFPWAPKPVMVMDQMALGKLQAGPALIGFSHHISDETKRKGFLDTLEHTAAELSKLSEEKGESFDIKLYSTKVAPETEKLNKAVKGLMSIDGDNVVVGILHLQGGLCYVSKFDENVTTDDLLLTIREFFEGNLDIQPLKMQG